MKIRIGKDINIRWEILTDGEPRPLEGRTLALYIQDYTRRRTEIPFTRDGNALLVSLRAAQLTRLGEYVLTLVENEDEEGQTAVDAKPAFTLVEYSTEEDNCPAAPELDVEQVRLDTANLVRTAGGIQPEELFAGKPVVMEKGDIVPVMRDGQLRPVRVPGTLHGKYKGVIHKAVPIYPRAGMAYVFRDNNLFVHVPDDMSKLYENLSILCENFLGVVDNSRIRSLPIFYTKGNARLFCYSFELIDNLNKDASDLIVVIHKLLTKRHSAIMILSDGVSIYSTDFRFKFVDSLNENVRMVSPHYAINSGRVVFTALPYIRNMGIYSLISGNTVLLRKKRTKRIYSEEGDKYYIRRSDFWSRFFPVDRVDKGSRIKGYLPYRMMRYETSFHSAKNPNYVEIRGVSLINGHFRYDYE